MKFVVACYFFLASLSAQAQHNSTPADKEAAYQQAINTRAEKIVAGLQLTAAGKKAAVTEALATQYKALNTIYTLRDEELKKVKESITDKEALATKVKAIEELTTAQTRRLHDAFMQQLSAHLPEEQINKIKDGMTYNVLNVTYTAMQDMIPSLKPAEKEQIMAWLKEAREQAMDAESSEKKHWWFGKYKGRINNYLAAQGYNLQAERKAWEERLKMAANQKKEAGSN